MKPRYSSNSDSFIIDNFNDGTPFSNFFPALAGVTGKPMWVFYTNRGQAISSFGINNKDGAMLEFLPANKAYQATPQLGFRTFIRFGGKTGELYEPFHTANENSEQSMHIRPYELEIRDRNSALGLEVSVVYFGIPHDSFPGLARIVTFKNTGKKTLNFGALDGLPRIVPWGMNDFLVKNMSRTIEAFAEVQNLKVGVPFFKLKIEPHDRPDVKWLHGGFFSFGLAGATILPVVVDPQCAFGQDTSFSVPKNFLENSTLPLSDQMQGNIMPSSLFVGSVSLAAGESKSWNLVFGYADTPAEAQHFAETAQQNKNYFFQKRQEMTDLYAQLHSHLGLKTGDENLNQYGRLTFMDNVLRGGLPVTLGQTGPLVHVFSRKHGDMERDYNAFHISSTYYSQGNGNFRDVNQNRRNDLYLTSQIGTTNIDVFFNLLQLDGYNPLVIDPTRFHLPKDIMNRVELRVTDRCKTDYQTLVSAPVLAGQIYEFIKKHAAEPLKVNNYFRDIMSVAHVSQSVKHGEGFWSDHWTYNLDHLDQYLSLFPEKKFWLLHEKNDFTFYDSDHVVQPRKNKYVITADKKLRQYNAVIQNNEKRTLISSRHRDAHKVRLAYGTGDIFTTTLFVKLLSLTAIKVSSLDPFGVGIEMDADKPGWCDALNGLPGLIGSSTHETFELLRLVRFLLKEAIPYCPNKTMDLPHDIIVLLTQVKEALEGDTEKDFRPVWDKLATAREYFREKTVMGLSDKIRPYRVSEMKDLLMKSEDVLTRALKKSMDPVSKLPTSYFYCDVSSSDLPEGWKQNMATIPWKQHRVVPFLEGAVHAMKIVGPSEGKKLYQSVKKSNLYDKSLKLYRLNESLENEPSELGRIKVFTPGWLENESVFLHMHYKYLLELLKSGLVDSFFDEIKDGWVVNRNPDQYGRSIFENSSFIASSSFPDKSIQGKGFVARLSGATSEFLSMLYYLTFGPALFKAQDGFVFFSPEPRLPKEWFNNQADSMDKNTFSLKIFGVPVTYVNPSKKNTFGPKSVKPTEYEWILDGRFHRHKGRQLAADASVALREGRLESLKIFLN